MPGATEKGTFFHNADILLHMYRLAVLTLLNDHLPLKRQSQLQQMTIFFFYFNSACRLLQILLGALGLTLDWFQSLVTKYFCLIICLIIH